MVKIWWIDRLTIMADVLVVTLLAGVCAIIYGVVLWDTNIISYRGGVLGLSLVLLIVARKFNKH